MMAEETGRTLARSLGSKEVAIDDPLSKSPRLAHSKSSSHITRAPLISDHPIAGDDAPTFDGAAVANDDGLAVQGD
jgi:hypothetical protein